MRNEGLREQLVLAKERVKMLQEQLAAAKPKRTVKQYTLDGVFVAEHKSCAAAAEAIGNRATRQDISLAARGKAHAAGGYRWKW
jgi:hypothetical protein